MFKGKIIERRGEITLANKAKMSMWNNHEQDYLEMKDSEVYQEEEEQFLIRNAVGHKGVQNWG